MYSIHLIPPSIKRWLSEYKEEFICTTAVELWKSLSPDLNFVLPRKLLQGFRLVISMTRHFSINLFFRASHLSFPSLFFIYISWESTYIKDTWRSK